MPETQLKISQRGFALVFALLIVVILMIASFSVLELILNGLIRSNVSHSSQRALYAADTGVECVLYYDIQYDQFNIPDSNIICNNEPPITVAVGGSDISNFNLTFSDNSCVEVRVDKSGSNPDCPETKINSKGYNTCAEGASRKTEREIEACY